MFNFVVKLIDLRYVCRIWHLGGFGGMENTPPLRADDLSSILGIFKNDPILKSVNNSLQQLDFDPNSITDFSYQSKLRPVQGSF